MRKRRTRSHIIADLSVNHVERHALLCGYSVERMVNDYGVDLQLYTYAEDGEVENDSIKIQMKATDTLPLLADGLTVSFPIERRDLEFWLEEWLPVILVVYDAQEDTAYWVYLQAYFQQRSEVDLRLIGETLTIHLSRQDVVTPAAIRRIAGFKARILQQYRNIRHESI